MVYFSKNRIKNGQKVDFRDLTRVKTTLLIKYLNMTIHFKINK